MANVTESEYSHWRPEQTQIIDSVPVRFRDICVHEFVIGDVDDPELYAADPLYRWQQSESGAWVMEHAVDKPYWMRHMNYNSYGYQYRVMARLSDKDETYWRLRWGGSNK